MVDEIDGLKMVTEDESVVTDERPMALVRSVTHQAARMPHIGLIGNNSRMSQREWSEHLENLKVVEVIACEPTFRSILHVIQPHTLSSHVNLLGKYI
jgi:hypothetical protein